jgi:L-threonylcarbamoyladenylate synthase
VLVPIKVQRIDPQRPDPGAIARAAELLRRGSLVAYPTETFYGLGCDPRQAAAVDRIFEAKGRPERMALPLIAGDAAAVGLCARDLPPSCRRLMQAFWPGPLTLVLAAALDLPPRLLGGGHTVGVRVSPHPVAAALALALGGPIVATSANRSGGPPPSTAEEVRDMLGDDVALVLDGGPTTGGSASTVIDLTVDPPRLVRSGAVPRAAIEKVLGLSLA